MLGQVWMLLTLAVKLREVRHGQHGRAAARWPAEQRSLKPVIILRSKRPPDLGSLGSL
jgi:hypothetical protein